MPGPDSRFDWRRALRVAAVALSLIAASYVLARQLHGHYAVQRWLFWRYAQYWLVALAFSAACSSGGFVVLRLIGPPHMALRERLLSSMAVGVLVFYFGMFLGGLLGIYGRVFAIAWPVVLAASGAWPFLRYARRAKRHVVHARMHARRWSNTELVALALGFLGLVMVYVNILTPDNISYDSRWYHLALPEHYAAAGAIRRSPEGWFHAALPQQASLIYLWPYLFSWTQPFDQTLMAAHLEFVLFVWTLAWVGPAVRWLVPGSRTSATWAAYFLFSGIFCYDSTLNGGADHIAAFWALPILMTLRRAWRGFEPRACVLLGVMLAGAMQTKAQAIEILVFPIVAVALRALWLASTNLFRRLRKHGPKTESPFAWLTGPTLTALTMLAASTPFWLKNWVWYGDPLYPALHKHLKLRPWHQDMEQFYATLVQRHFWRPEGTGLAKAKETLTALFTFSFKPHDWDFMHGDWPVFGFLFTMSWFVMPFIGANRRVWATFLAGHVAVLTWFLFSHQDRYLQIAVPWMVVLVAAVILHVWRLGWFARLPLLGLLTLQGVWGGAAYFIPSHVKISGGRPLPQLFELFSTGYRHADKDRLKVFPDMAVIEAELPANAKVLLHRYEQHAGLRRDVVMDHPSWQGLISYSRIPSHRALHELYRKLHVTHIVWRDTDVLAEDNMAGDLRFHGFVTHVATNEKALSSAYLAELPADPPRQEASDKVLYLGCHGYKAGLYELGDMTVFEMNRGTTPYPAPRQSLRSPALADVDALARQANYVVQNSGCSQAYASPSTLASAFVHRARRYEEHLFVRRVPLPGEARE